jgi:alpha-N-arabinofuranosidase
MACQFNSGQLVPMDQLDPYIQDALDLIEFANGASTTTWGAKRAAMGHPAPFKMKMLGIGNEQWGPQFIERYAAFARVLKAAHPEITLISSSGPAPADDRFKFAWEQLRPLKAEIIDEHCYAAPKWFIDSATRYDDYDRSGPKVFMGEYAAQSVAIASPNNRNNLECALAEAAFMTGLERNADVVRLASYAPLFGHVEGWQWTPNLIWCDDLSVYGTPNYYVQKLFSLNRGDVVLPIEAAPREVNSPDAKVFVSAVRDDAQAEIIIKAVNPGPAATPVTVEFTGLNRLAPKGEATVLSGAPTDENSLAEPRRVAPSRGPFQAGQTFNYELKPHSFSVMRVKAK